MLNKLVAMAVLVISTSVASADTPQMSELGRVHRNARHIVEASARILSVAHVHQFPFRHINWARRHAVQALRNVEQAAIVVAAHSPSSPAFFLRREAMRLHHSFVQAKRVFGALHPSDAMRADFSQIERRLGRVENLVDIIVASAPRFVPGPRFGMRSMSPIPTWAPAPAYRF